MTTEMLKDDTFCVWAAMQMQLTSKTAHNFSVLYKKSYANNIQHSKQAKAEKSATELSRLVSG